MEVTLDIPDRQVKFIQYLAKKAGLPAEQYAINIIRGWCESQIRDIYINKVRNMTIEQIRNVFGDLHLD